MVAFLILVCPRAGAEPFQSQWDWHRPKLFGNVKMIMREENVYNIREIYDQHGRKLEEQLLNKGNIIYKIILRYDDNDRLTSIEKYAADGKSLIKDEALYQNGVLKYIKSTEEPQQGKFFYDPKGFLNEIVVSKGNGEKVGKYVYKFNQYGELIEKQILNALFELREKKVYFYNEKGLPVGELTYKPDNKLIRKEIFSYSYDNQGNWVTRKTESEVFIGDEKGKASPTLEKRKLTYF